MFETLLDLWNSFSHWASAQPVFLQVFIGIVIFFICLYSFYFIVSGIFTAYIIKTGNSSSKPKHGPFFWPRRILSFAVTATCIAIIGYIFVALIISCF